MRVKRFEAAWPLFGVLVACAGDESPGEQATGAHAFDAQATPRAPADLEAFELAAGELEHLEIRRLSDELALARNTPSELIGRVTPAGARLVSTRDDGWAVSMRLSAYGRPGRLEATGSRAVDVASGRARLEDGGPVTEWYASGASGLEHGFTLARAPDGVGETLRLFVDVDGASVHAAGPRALVFSSGGESLRYERLLAWDATGALLDASMRPSEGGFVVDVEAPDQARYPVTVDPTFTRTHDIFSNQPLGVAANDAFGHAVDIDGDRMVVGAPFDGSFWPNGGAFYAYTWDPAVGWVYEDKYAPAGHGADENTGWDVDIEGDRLVVGSPGRLVFDGPDARARTGRSDLFVRSGGAWQHQKIFEVSQSAPNAELGRSVALRYPYMFMGSPREECTSGPDVGTGCVHYLNVDTNMISAPSPVGLSRAGARFGQEIVASTDLLYISAPGDERTGSGSKTGSIYFWNLGFNGGDTWDVIPFPPPDPMNHITAPTPRPGGEFGASLTLSAGRLIVGEPGGPVPNNGMVGRVHSYDVDDTRAETTWRQTLNAPGVSTGFGLAVGVSGDDMLVAEPFGSPGGQVRAFERSAGMWSQVAAPPVTLPSAVIGDKFGFDVALSGDRAVVGAPGRDDVDVDAGAVYVVEVDDPPDPGAPIVESVAEDSSVDITLTATDPDTVDSELVYSMSAWPTSGVVNLSGDVLTYTPSADFFGQDSLRFGVSDGTNTSTQLITLNVTPVNDPPVGTPQTLVVDEDSSASTLLEATDIDTNASSLTFALVEPGAQVGSPAQNGFVTGTPPNVTYTPTPGFNGADAFDFTVSDGEFTELGRVTVTVTPVNDPPAAADSSTSTLEDTPVGVTFSVQDPDTDAADLTFTVIVPPGGARAATHGEVTGSGASVTYTPDADYVGADSFGYTVSDGEFESGGTVTINVTPVNDAPTATARAVTLDEDTPTEVELVGEDIDTATSALTYAIVTPPANGTLGPVASGRVTYSPSQDHVGSDSFTYTASDGELTSAPARVDLTIEPVDDRPVALPQQVQVDEDERVLLQLTGEDAEGSLLSFAVVTDPRSGSVDTNGSSTVNYTPGPNFVGEDTFEFIATADGVDSLPATVTVTVAPVNDPPTTLDGSARTTADAPVTLTLSGEDVDGDELSFVIMEEPTSGSLSMVDGDQVEFDPLGVTGEVTFTYKADDGEVDSEDAGTFTITVVEAGTELDAGGEADAGGGDAGGVPPRERPDLVGCAVAPERAPPAPWALGLASLGLIGLARLRRRAAGCPGR